MDLPQIESGGGCEEMDYDKKPSNSYQRWARRNSKKIYNHIAMRHTKRLIERFSKIGYGQSVADVDKEYQ